MSLHIKIRKGLNIRLKGEADKVFFEAPFSDTYAIKPPEFRGLVPRVMVNKGDEVKAGSPLFHHKYNEKLLVTSPVSGEIADVIRGPRRIIEEIRILADREVIYESFPKADPDTLTREAIISLLLRSGAWPLLRQRPYSEVANPEHQPKAIFISAFDTAPLAPDNDFIVHGHGTEFQTGLNAIAKLTPGKVHLNINAGATTSKVFTNSRNVQINRISGPHPAGNVGIQIHHIDPINKGEIVWYLYPQDVLLIGRLFIEGKFNAQRIVALTGSEVKKGRNYKTIMGTSIKPMVAGNVHEGKLRYISGNVLTGAQISPGDYLGFYDTQITIIPEGDRPQLLGWLAPNLHKFSHSRTFPAWLMPNNLFRLTTNTNGERRAFVMTGEYEKLLPMEIYPVHLLKAILIKDVELIEQLGIYEVSEEDFALCEFACTSKIPVQQIIREGLELIKKEMG